MIRIFSLVFLFLFIIPIIYAQDAIRARIIFIGDAGEMDEEQKTIIPDAASKYLADKTTYMYLGDNIYPRGMGLPGSEEEAKTQQILRSQYAPLRAKGAPVYFIPGNHDWDRMGPKGLAKIKRQGQFLKEQNDSLLQLVPGNGCPGPVEINIADSLVIIALDSEWWLYQFDKSNPEGACACNTEAEVNVALQEIFYRNRYKVILLATHHPFQSYGTHGGYFSWKDHIFPLTAVKENLYIPLPVIGSLYPFFRRTFTNPEDLRHPLYKDMVHDVDGVFGGFPNLVHVSGHEHGLQFIKNKVTKQTQVVSGGGAKQNYTIKGKNSLFGLAAQGYVVADFMENNDVRFTYYVYREGTVKSEFQQTIRYTPYDIIEEDKYDDIAADSVVAQAHKAYQKSNRFSKFIFGRNFRTEWSLPTKLPVLRISELYGGLNPDKLGGGYQSTSLRLKDTNGKEYALRTVEKKADKIVPVPFQGTFVRELMDDATSAQHPYSALIVAPVAAALDVPHSVPTIGVVAPDKRLGMYEKLFEGRVALIEEREPLGESDNYNKFSKNLQKDNDNTYDANNFLLSRMIDVLFADWDRHDDQYRFYNNNKKGEHKFYTIVPRDRDMVLSVTHGFLPTIIKRLFLMPRVHGFKKNVVGGVNYYLYKSSFLNAHPANQIPHHDFSLAAISFKEKVTDSVLVHALQQFPREVYEIDHDDLLATLRLRRDKMPEAMEKYYRFSNRVVDIKVSDKNEFVAIKDIPGESGTNITIRKINREGELKDTLMSKDFPDKVTKEIRIYLAKGSDSVWIDNGNSSIKMKLIGGDGSKIYNLKNARKKIKIYDKKEERYLGDRLHINKRINEDSLHTAFTSVNLYNTTLPLVTAAINPDDGLFLGAGVLYNHQGGFRKYPYSSSHQFLASHSFSTNAFNVQYEGTWIQVIGKADLNFSADIKAPNNVQNFFGRGNETPFDKTGNFKRYYRTRFNLMDFNAAFSWRGVKGSTLSIGPALQYYHFESEENTGRFIMETPQLGTYDSAVVASDKVHLGLIAKYQLDQRNNKVLPTWGSFIHMEVQGYKNLDRISTSFVRILPEVALYKSLNTKQTIVLADRFGGGITVGKSAFYQSMFLGGHGNLMGYRQYRFAGQHSFYNNLELRIALSNFGNYIFKGQFGMFGFYDIGRVWVGGEQSNKWHNGVGAGLYLAPASLVVFRASASWSEEGWYPNFAMKFRF